MTQLVQIAAGLACGALSAYLLRRLIARRQARSARPLSADLGFDCGGIVVQVGSKTFLPDGRVIDLKPDAHLKPDAR